MLTTDTQTLIKLIADKNSTLRNYLTELLNYRNTVPTSATSSHTTTYKEYLEKIDNILIDIESNVNISNVNIDVLRNLGFDILVTPKRQEIFKQSIALTTTNSSTVRSEARNSYQRLVIALENVVKTNIILSNIYPILQTEIDETNGIVELIFDGEVSIEDFSSAKEQMSDWYIIIDGYARLAGTSNEDFQIVSISKASPTRYKIKSTLKNIALIISVIEGLLSLEKTLIDRNTMISKLEKNPIVSDTVLHEQVITQAKQDLEKITSKRIEEIVDRKLKEHDIGEGHGDIKTHLNKSIQLQYNFITHGGTVNVYVQPGQLQKEISAFDTAKKVLLEAKEIAKDNIELPPPSNDSLLQSGE